MIFNVLALVLTNACPNRCKYCYNKERIIYGNMSSQIIQAAFQIMEKQPISQYHISLLGGEPYLRLKVFFKEYNNLLKETSKNISITINTNGLLWTQKVCEEINQYKNISLAISLDGPKKIHDLNRISAQGQGTYDILIKKIPMLLKYFPDSLCQTTFTPSTISGLSDSYFLAKELGFKKWYWAPDLYESLWQEQDYKILNKQLQIIAKDYFQQNKIQYAGFDLNNMRNLGNPRFAKNSHVLRVDTTGTLTISRINATLVNPIDEEEWNIGNVLNGIDKEKEDNWINKYGENADKLYYAYNLKEVCNQCFAKHICFDTKHSFNNPYLFKIQSNQPRIQCEQKKAIMNAIQNL